MSSSPEAIKPISPTERAPERDKKRDPSKDPSLKRRGARKTGDEDSSDGKPGKAGADRSQRPSGKRGGILDITT